MSCSRWSWPIVRPWGVWTSSRSSSRATVLSSTSGSFGSGSPIGCLPRTSRARVITVPSLPLTPNGKTDRGQIEGDVARMLSSVAYEPTVHAAVDGASERLVAEGGRTELRRESVGTTTSSTSVATRCSPSPCSDAFATGSVDLSLTDVFRYPTVRSFAAHVADLERRSSGDGTDTSRTESSTGADSW